MFRSNIIILVNCIIWWFMESFAFIDDEVIWQAASQGDRDAEELLLKKYSKLVRICSRPFFLAGGDGEDLVQEGTIGLLTAIRQFDPARDVSFNTYAQLCIKSRLYMAIKSAKRSKHTPLNDYVSFESPQFDEAQTRIVSFLRDPEDEIIARERVEEIEKSLSKSLSGLESRVLEQYLVGSSYSEIGDNLGISVKSVDNAVQRIRKKLATSI